METREPQWLSLAEADAAARYDVGTRTVPATTGEYLTSLVDAGMLTGRRVDGPARVEIRSDALELLVERDLESFLRRELDEDLAS